VDQDVYNSTRVKDLQKYWNQAVWWFHGQPSHLWQGSLRLNTARWTF